MEIPTSNNNLEIETNTLLKKKKKPLWTKEEDELLLKKGKEYQYKNWKLISSFLPGHSPIQCSARYRRIQTGIKKGNWKKEEDEKLLKLYKKYGKNWAKISKEMRSRTGKQIRDRFLNSLDETIRKRKFTQKEDKEIIKLYKIYGNSWSSIAKHLNGRTGDMVKNRFYSRLNKIINENDNENFNNNENENDNKKENETIESYNKIINQIDNNYFSELKFKDLQINGIDKKNSKFNERYIISNLIMQNQILNNQIKLMNEFINKYIVLHKFENQNKNID